jgi:hypothetical protein
MKLLQKLLLGTLLLPATISMAAETRLAVPMDYQLLRSVLIKQLYSGENQTARLWKEGQDCSFLDLSNPQIQGDKGLIKIDNNVHARVGLQLAGKCIPALEWHGILQTWQQPSLDSLGNQLRFPITQTAAFDSKGQPLNIKQLQDLLNKAVQHQLANLKIDLDQSRGDIIKTLLPYIDAADTEALQDTVNSLRFNQVAAGDKALTIDIGFNGEQPANSASQPAAAFNAHELKQWRTVWHALEQSLESGLNQPALEGQSAADKETLRSVMAEAGTAFEQGLTEKDLDPADDPVRTFFNESWDKLGPLLRKASTQLPGAEPLRYLTLIAATDVMYELDRVSKPLGLEISANGLRKLARAYLQHEAAQKKIPRGK